jgi:CO/xanthine dehydrogenase FAD-binding subunit
MSLWKNYLVPTSIDEAIAALNTLPGSKAVIAGGTDLLLDLDQGRHPPVDTLVDISSIEEMQEIRIETDGIFIGAAVTHNQIVQNSVLEDHARCLVEGCGLIGGPQVRNVATIGGNVAHALPAGDGTIALVALDAEACLVNSNNETWKPIGELFAGPGKTTFDRTRELIKGFRIPLAKSNEASAFNRIMRPQGVAIAILNMAAWMRLASDQTIEKVRISIGPGGPTPFRAYALEELLRGCKINQDTLDEATKTLLRDIQLRTSPYRATEAYRRHIISTLLERSVGRIQEELSA